jgi:MOZ/SAS family
MIRVSTDGISALSELGRRAYMHYWTATIARFIANLSPKETVTVKSISSGTYILPEDIVASLKEMDVVERRKIGEAEAVINRAKVRSWMAQNRIDMAGPVHANAFVNEPTMLENGE